MSDQPAAPKPKLPAFAAITVKTARALSYDDTPEGRTRLVCDASGVPATEPGVVRHLRSDAAPLEWPAAGYEIGRLLGKLATPRIVVGVAGHLKISQSIDSAQAAMVLARAKRADAAEGCEWTLELVPITETKFLWRFATDEMAQTLCFDGPSMRHALGAIEADREMEALKSSVSQGRPGGRSDIDGGRGGGGAK